MLTFDPNEAFERNLGLITKEEQRTLAQSLVAIPGCGGVGGMHAHVLARLGIGRFRISDPDTFSVANFNRQIGANIHTIERNKAEVTAEMIASINPDAAIETIPGGITEENIESFVEGASLVVDGLDFFALPTRRKIFAAAWSRGIPVLSSGPFGFSASLHVFGPGGMSFDKYFDFHDDQDPFEQIVNFVIGVVPSALHRKYMDYKTVDPTSGRAPSSVVGTQLTSCLIGTEAVRILLNRGPALLAPHYLQIDLYTHRIKKGKLAKGNRGLLQRMKRKYIRQQLIALGFQQALTRNT